MGIVIFPHNQADLAACQAMIFVRHHNCYTQNVGGTSIPVNTVKEFRDTRFVRGQTLAV